jgi:integrase
MSRIIQDNFSLYGPAGDRKYINRHERRRALVAMARLERERWLFAVLMTVCGARVSEVLDVRPLSFQVEECIVALRTLKRRGFHMREVPIPRQFMMALDRHFRIGELQADPVRGAERLWSFSRITAWRFIKSVLLDAGAVGRAATTRGLRHGFGIATVQAGVPVHIVQRWMGHARVTSTMHYMAALGPEDRAFARRYWQYSELVNFEDAVASD